jgi:5-methylcytosine-specific restriction enzyme A
MPTAARTHSQSTRTCKTDCRKSACKRGYDRSWRKFRKRFLAGHPLCADCTTNGRTTAATDVHHIKKLTDSPDMRMDDDNCMALCKGCHSVRTARGE